jgi:hypothetical protein
MNLPFVVLFVQGATVTQRVPAFQLLLNISVP